jgi:potassium-transporting ATPase KdpC subunit
MQTHIANDIRRSLIAIAVTTLFLGLLYPAVMTGFAQLAFGDNANGSLIRRDGRTVGSSLAGQRFTGPRYFHSRPSATAPPYNAGGTTFSNLGPNSKAEYDAVKQRIATVMKLERPYNPDVRVGDIPVDAVTASGSGIDPDISRAYAELQAPRIAAERGISLDRVHSLIDEHVDGRFLGFFGEPGVNVLELNLALDQESR